MWYRAVLERQSCLPWVCFSVPKEIIFSIKLAFRHLYLCKFISVAFVIGLKTMSWLP